MVVRAESASQFSIHLEAVGARILHAQLAQSESPNLVNLRYATHSKHCRTWWKRRMGRIITSEPERLCAVIEPQKAHLPQYGSS